MTENKIDQQKAEIERLLEECDAHVDALAEFQWRMSRVKQIQGDVAVRMKDFMAAVKETGQMSALQSAVELLQRLQCCDEKVRQLRTTGSSTDVV